MVGKLANSFNSRTRVRSEEPVEGKDLEVDLLREQFHRRRGVVVGIGWKVVSARAIASTVTYWVFPPSTGKRQKGATYSWVHRRFQLPQRWPIVSFSTNNRRRPTLRRPQPDQSETDKGFNV